MSRGDADGTWDELCAAWNAASRRALAGGPRDAGAGLLEQARRRADHGGDAAWRWFAAALADPEREWFAVHVLARCTVPRRLFEPLLRAGVLEPNPDLNRRFVEPCVRSQGVRRTLERLLEYLETGADAEKAGAVNALYWVRASDWRSGETDEEPAELRAALRHRLLREFVANDDVSVRRCILPALSLDPTKYPPDLRPLVPQAVAIARSHPDEYIRHRIEIQLGAAGPYLPLPNVGA